LYGPEMADAYQVLKQSGYEGNLLHTEDFDELHTHVMAKTHRGDLVLVKGSRAMAMERLVPSLTSIA
jgi:UDP-N-acetylmuramoyl-tripeptide--D-alanyl-D-alanine ligase